MERMLKIANLTIAAIGLFFMAGSYGCTTQNNENQVPSSNKMEEHADNQADPLRTQDAIEFRKDMRRLWDDHALWMRNAILCLVDGLPGKDPVMQRLLKNQEDIGAAFKPYYGKDAGKDLTSLLYSHVHTSADLVLAAKAGNQPALDRANERATANADSISEFLNKANPDNWGLKDMKKMMHEHLSLTTQEANMRIKKDYEGDIKAYGKVEDAILEMADMLAEGVIKQFPEKFIEKGMRTAAQGY